ncbi:MAG: cyclic nucleotide-binding protein [Desulfobacteraceae bacterium]|nr:cyclic nucleotide-binding protein [Desulfobacteraceae bacterium]
MLRTIGKWLNVYEDEIHLFLWTFFLYFLLTGSNVILNNYAETAFLKRYGVEYLPIVYMLNSIALFFIMGAMTGIMVKFPGTRILSYLFVFCGVSVAGIRFLIPFNIDLIYPALFMLKAQYEALLGLLFWNLANDLFNTRQSKRLFSLITAGGVIGSIIGSFGTPFLAKAITLDNLLLFYLGTTLVGAVVVKRMEKGYPTLLFSDKKSKKSKTRSNLIAEFKHILPLMKESSLIKILILLTFLPNIIIPILNYQFNFAVNEQYATESGLIQFFGYFRGSLNIVSLIILLFVGRIYSRWGLPVALMFHPANYVLAFLAFLFRFDIFSAMYARMSTMVLRVTINNPARNILMGLIPESLRSVLRPFLRGTVVRVGLLLGSGMILISEKLFHPRYLSLLAIPFAAAWLASVLSLKKEYSKILLDLISKDMLDLKALEERDLEHVFSGKEIKSRLIQAFLDSRGNRSLWYARLLKALGIKDLDQPLLIALGYQDDRTRIGLIEFLSPKSGRKAASLLMDLAKSEKNQDLTVAALQAINRLDFEFSEMVDFEYFTHHHHPEIKAHALIGLYRRTPEKYHPTIQSYLRSDALKDRQTGVIVAGGSGDKLFTDRLKEMLVTPENEPIVPDILNALYALKEAKLNYLAHPYLSHQTGRVRLAALSVLEIDNDELLRKVISMMGDSSGDIFQMAQKKIETAPYQNTQLLVESLAIPNSRIRKAIFNLLESLNIKDLDVFRFAQNQIKDSYQYLSDALSLETFPENDSRDLLVDHLNQKKLQRIENILRVLALQDTSGEMKIIYRGILSSDSRKRANAMEALENMMDKRLYKEMIPLMESSSPQESLNIGRKRFQLIGLDSGEKVFITHLLACKDWVTVALTLDLIRNHKPEQLDSHIISEFITSENKYVRWTARKIIDQELEKGVRHDG